MNKLEIPDNALTEAVKSADKHVGQTYDNLTQPATKAVGNGVGDIVELVFSPFRFFKDGVNLFFEHKLKVYKKELEEKEKSIPADKKIEPDFHAVSMALDNSKFCITNDELRKMFVNLIGNTMNTDKKDIAHPAFSEIIKQMTTLDALILETFRNMCEQPIIKVIVQLDEEKFRQISNRIFFPQSQNTKFYAENNIHPEKLSISISNCERLGLLDITYEHRLADDNLYSDYDKAIKGMKKEVSLEKGIVYLTEVGRAFIKACME